MMNIKIKRLGGIFTTERQADNIAVAIVATFLFIFGPATFGWLETVAAAIACIVIGAIARYF